MTEVDKTLESMLEQHGAEAFIEEMWKVYAEWPNPDGQEKTVMRYNRKAILRGEKVSEMRLTHGPVLLPGMACGEGTWV